MSFHTSQAAINVLRAGKKHPRWKEAAEFVIDRATPEVKLLLAVGRQLERDAIAEANAEKASAPWPLQKILKYAAIVMVTALVSGGAGYLFAGILKLC